MTALTTKQAYRPEEAGEQLGISRAKVYELIREGAIGSVKIGRSRRVPHAALEAYLEGLLQAQAEEAL